MMQDAEATPEEAEEEVLPESSAPKRRSLLDDQLARVVEDAKDEKDEVEVIDEKKDENPPEARFWLPKSYDF